jgi:hypothetical protein
LTKILKRVAIVVLALVLYYVALGIWAKIPPWRPANVPKTSVFLFGLPVGSPFPEPKQGTWVNCWLDTANAIDRCSSFNVDGAPIYEGPYIRYEGTGAVPQNELQIIAKISGDHDYFRGVNVPIVHLRSGVILIPAEDANNARAQASYWLRYDQQ